MIEGRNSPDQPQDGENQNGAPTNTEAFVPLTRADIENVPVDSLDSIGLHPASGPTRFVLPTLRPVRVPRPLEIYGDPGLPAEIESRPLFGPNHDKDVYTQRTAYALEPPGSRLRPLQISRRTDFSTWRDNAFPTLSKNLFFAPSAIHLGFGAVMLPGRRYFDFTFPHDGRSARRGGPKAFWQAPDILHVMGRAPEREDAIQGPFLSLGSVLNHFGHFLLQVLPKLWAVDWATRNGVRLLFFGDGRMATWQAELLKLAGIDLGAITWVDKSACLSNVYFPSSLYHLHEGCNPDLQDLAARVAEATGGVQSTRRRLLLLRPEHILRLKDQGSFADLFERYGYQAIRPETLPLRQQIAMARDATHVAGPIGSAMYLAMFQTQPVETSVLASPRFCFADDAIIAGMKGSRCRYIFPDVTPLEKGARRGQFELSLDLVEQVLAGKVAPLHG